VRRKRRTNLLIAALVLLWGAAVLIAGFVAVFDPRIFPGCNLDRKRWDEARRLVSDFRSNEAFEKAEPEVEDIVKCEDLIYGKTRPEVRELLGNPGQTSNRKFFFYNVGIPEGLSDYPGLDIRFDQGGTAVEAFVSGYIER
jgi:hypothetical protein